MDSMSPVRATARLLRAVVAAAAAAALALGLTSASAQAAPIPFPEVPRAGISFNGTVYSVVMSGDVVFVGGSFTSVTGSNGTLPRSRLAALQLSTGRVLAFRADANAPVRALALAPGGSLFVGGDFTSVGSAARSRFAEVDATTGTVRTTRRDADARVRALAVVGDRIYVGGDFSRFHGAARSRIAALTISSRQLVAGFSPSFNGDVYAITGKPDGSVVYVGGAFTRAAGRAHRYLTGLGRGGAVQGPVFDLVSENQVLALATDGTRLFAGVGGAKTGNQVARFDPVTGAKRWFHHMEGDVQAVAYYGGNVYFGFHEGAIGDLTVRLLAADAATGALQSSFRPTMNSFWGVWAVAASARGIVAGGEFTTVSGRPAGRFALFAAADLPQPAISGLSFMTPPSPVVVLGPHGGSSSTPVVRVTTRWPATHGSVSSVTVSGDRVGAPAAAPRLAFARRCGSTASCVGAGATVTAAVPLSFDGRGGRRDRNRITALAHPGVYLLRPSVVTGTGPASYSGAPLSVHYVRATRISSFGATPEPVRAGSTVVVSGRVMKATACADGSRAKGCRQGQLGRWLPVRQRAVSIFFDPAGSAPARLVASAVPGSSGRFAISAVQTATGRWYAELRATSTFGGSRSRYDRVTARV
jgi:hypothetical protein